MCFLKIIKYKTKYLIFKWCTKKNKFVAVSEIYILNTKGFRISNSMYLSSIDNFLLNQIIALICITRFINLMRHIYGCPKGQLEQNN